MNMTGFISQSQTEEKAKYSVVINKLTNVISIFDRLYGNSKLKKLVQTDYNTLKLTSLPVVILDNIKMNHPLVKLLVEYVKKMDTLGDSSKFFLLTVKYLIEESIKIVDRGVKPTLLSEIYRDINNEISNLTKDLIFEIKLFENKLKEENLNEIATESKKDKDSLIENNSADNVSNTEKIDGIAENDATVENKEDLQKIIADIDITEKIEKLNVANIVENVKTAESQPTLSLLLDSLITEENIKQLLIESITQTQSVSNEKIRVYKMYTGTIEDSYIVKGMLFDREPETKRKTIRNGSSAIYNCPLDIPRAELKSTILLKTSDELYNYSKDEVNYIKEKVDSLNSDVIICSGKVDNIFLDFCNKNNKIVFKILSKHDLRRIRDCLGGYISPTLEPISDLGKVSEIDIIKEGNKTYTKFLGNNIQTLVIKSGLDVILDDVEMNINKALRALSKNMKDKKIEVVEGSGIFELKLARVFETKLKNMPSDTEDEDNLRHAYKSLIAVFDNFKQLNKKTFDIYKTKVKAIKYALDFVATMYETEDYLIGIPDKMNIKPRMNEDWDEDH